MPRGTLYRKRYRAPLKSAFVVRKQDAKRWNDSQRRRMSRQLAMNSGLLRSGGAYSRSLPGATEWKNHDLQISGTMDSTGEIAPGGGTSTSLNLIPEGTQATRRIGRKCVIKSINIRGRIFFSASVSASTTSRMMLVLDTQANGAYPAYSAVMNTGFSEDPANFLNLDNTSRFRILRTWYHVWDRSHLTIAGTQYGAVMKKIQYFKKCHIPLEFSSTTGAITEIKSNNLFIMWDTEADDEVTANLIVRLRFIG